MNTRWWSGPAWFALSAASVSSALSMMDANPTLFLYDAFVATDRRRKEALTGKRIWITGASSGIGAELAKQLACHGARLVLSARDEGKLLRVAEQCRAHHHPHPDPAAAADVQVLPMDVTDDRNDAVREFVRRAGPIDILILNAGRGQTSTALLTNSEQTRELMEVNYFAPVRLATELLRQRGWATTTETTACDTSDRHIVVTSSVAAKMALPLSTSYAGSKFAAHGFFTSLRSEYGNRLRVDLPCPGPVRTSFSDSALSPETTVHDNNNNNNHDEPGPSTKKGDTAKEQKMSAERCARLIVAGMVGPKHLFYETWIAEQPTLGVLALSQYFPTLANVLLQWVGRIRVRAWEDGLPLYELSGWLRAWRRLRGDVEKNSGGNDDEDDTSRR